MQFKKSGTHRQTDRHTQTHRAYKWLQVPPFKLTLNVGYDKTLLISSFPANSSFFKTMPV